MTVNEVYERWLNADGKFRAKIPPTLRAAIMIHTGQAIIDNGGFQYFFGADFPEALHKDFVAAYDLLGFTELGEKLTYVLSLFPEKQPQKDLNERRTFIEARFDSDTNKDVHEIERFFWAKSDEVFKLIDRICEDF